jgi:phosphoribosylglycinamide formyltransferase-1
MKKIAVFASGSGTNAESIVRHFFDSKLAYVDIILTENPNAYVLKRAEKLSVKSYLFSKEELVDGSVTELLLSKGVDFIVLAGFLKLIPKNMITAYPERIVNIHPALLPKYGGRGMFGMNVHSAVISSGESESGITIHFVNEHYDDGDIVFQAKCPVLREDTIETLAERIHKLEHEHYPIIIERLIEEI